MKMMAEVKRSLTDYNVGKCVFHEDIVDYVTRVLQNFLLYRMPENIRWTFFFMFIMSMLGHVSHDNQREFSY